jgi:hypothetical protein
MKQVVKTGLRKRGLHGMHTHENYQQLSSLLTFTSVRTNRQIQEPWHKCMKQHLATLILGSLCAWIIATLASTCCLTLLDVLPSTLCCSGRRGHDSNKVWMQRRRGDVTQSISLLPAKQGLLLSS